MTIRNAATIVLFSVILWVSLQGCESGLSTENKLRDLRRAVEAEIADPRIKATFLAAVGRAEDRLDQGNPQAAAEILNGLSYLALIARQDITDRATVGTMQAVHDLFSRGPIRDTKVARRMVLIKHPLFACNIVTGLCDIPDTLQDWCCTLRFSFFINARVR